jgi:hypothetical protein
VYDSGEVDGTALRFSTVDLGPEAMRYSIRAWDDAGKLVTHQITTIAQEEIAGLDFDTIGAGFKFASGEIDLSGNTKITGTSGGEALWVVPVAATTGVRIDAAALTSTWDALEIDMGIGGSDGAQALEVQRGSSDRTAQINADGSAWFQDDNKPLPEFLPIAFGSIAADGTVGAGSGNFSCSLSGGIYKITVVGHDASWPEYSMVVTSYNLFPTLATVWYSSDEFWVAQRDELNDTDITGPFSFVIYQN